MSAEQRFERLAEIFERARDLEGSERAAYLTGACGADVELRARVDALLAAHDARGVLDHPLRAPGHIGQGEVEPVAIGRYRIIECIGRGGMGTVYRAEQDRPKRVVAVKVVQPGVASPESLRRFELEAALLGRLQHPGIAQIHEAGTTDDGSGARPFFAMEFVDGVRLDAFLAREGPAVEARLHLFCALCDAVQHAHQKGIIHRDLKPANILVTADGAPMILDFGVARATDADVQATLQTLPGQIVGTLAYMSPEQINAGSGGIDTRSDVYALGVLLYEMLAGRLPYMLSDHSIAGAARVISEVDPAPLTTASRAYRGDLATIVATALRKAPPERYQSASDLAADVRHFLQHEPINARPATAVYQMRKFARRHRGLVGGLVAAFVILCVGTVGVAWQTAQVAVESKTRSDVAVFLREMLTSLDPARTGGEPLTVRMMLDDAAGRLATRFGDAPLVRADLESTVGLTYFRIGEYVAAEGHLRRAASRFENAVGVADERTINAIKSLAMALREQDRLDEAEDLLRRTLDRLGDNELPGAIDLQTNLGVTLGALGRSDESETLFRFVYEHELKRCGVGHLDTLFAQGNLAQMLLQQGRAEEALPLSEACLQGRRAAHGDDHPLTIFAIANHGAVLSQVGRTDEADALMREAVERSDRVLGPAHLHTLRRRMNLVREAFRSGSLASATERVNELVDVCTLTLGPAHAETLAAVELLVTVVATAESIEAAEALALDWHARVVAQVGAEHRSAGRMAFLLYNVYDSWGRSDLMAQWLARTRASDFRPSERFFNEAPAGDAGGADTEAPTPERETDEAPR